MNQRFVSVLVFAFLVAAGASLLLYRLMASHETPKPAVATTKVIVAAHNLDLGSLIRDVDLKDGDWSGPIPTGAVLKKEDIVGRGVLSTIYEGEPILESRLAAKGAGGGLAAMIPDGMRAVAVRVNEVVGVAGFVVPGMRVDVLISGNPPGSTGGSSETRTLLQNIEVLSAGQDFKKDAEGKPVVVQVINLLVTPQQAEMLSLAMNQATIQLVLRNPLDTKIAKTSGVALASLYSGHPGSVPARHPVPVRRSEGSRPQPVVAAQPPKPKPYVVEMISGTKRTETKFQSHSEVR